MLLAKAEADAWWKKLTEGGEERGYYELLKEAVDAGERVTGTCLCIDAVGILAWTVDGLSRTACMSCIEHTRPTAPFRCTTDEPVKPFEQLGDDSLRLLDAIHERQAYIQAGERAVGLRAWHNMTRPGMAWRCMAWRFMAWACMAGPETQGCSVLILSFPILCCCAGLVDPEGFDDFRVVLSESGLQPSQAQD